MIIGCDNGLKGGLVAISAFDGSLIDKLVMPTLKYGNKSEIDVVAVSHWIDAFNTDCTVAIEEPLKHARSSQAIRSMALSFGQLVAMVRLSRHKLLRVEVSDWQKKMLGKVPKGQTKVVALKKSQIFLPEENWLATTRSSVAHDGLVDAYLIAQYVRNFNTKPHS